MDIELSFTRITGLDYNKKNKMKKILVWQSYNKVTTMSNEHPQLDVTNVVKKLDNHFQELDDSLDETVKEYHPEVEKLIDFIKDNDNQGLDVDEGYSHTKDILETLNRVPVYYLDTNDDLFIMSDW